MLAAALAFAGVAALINIVPGLDTLLVMRTSVIRGRRAGLAAGAGINAGCVVWGVATAAGLSALLVASHVAYDALRIAGACYLTWLGLSTLWRVRRRDGTGEAAQAERLEVVRAAGWFSAFRSGLMTNLLNPKAGAFYMSLLPQFVPHGAPVFGMILLLTAIDVVELSIWFFVLSGASAALRGWLGRPSVKRRIEQLSGVAFIGFAVNLAARG